MMGSSSLLLLLKRSTSFVSAATPRTAKGCSTFRFLCGNSCIRPSSLAVLNNNTASFTRRIIDNGTRMLATTSSGGNTGTDDNTKSNDGGNDDPYGLHYLDGEEGLGPEEKLPPRYMRDPRTGFMISGQTYNELTSRDKILLNMTREETIDVIQKQVEESLSKQKEEKLTDRVLSFEAEKAEAVRENHPDRKEWEKLKKKYFYLLKQKEKRIEEKIFEKKNRNMTEPERKYQKLLETHDLLCDDDDKQEEENYNNTISLEDMAHPDKRPSNPWAAENLAWVAQDVNFSQEEIYMPPELSRARKLNRKLATPIPKELIHHNNLDLLRRYVTPGGQIKNRIQSRLGAKDQRKISKLVKRARAIGLIPYVGQWKVQDDGDLFDPSLDDKKDWEKVYEHAGLLNSRKSEPSSQIVREVKGELLRKARALGLDIDEKGNVVLDQDLKNLEKKLMMDPKALLKALMKKEDDRL